MNTILSILLLIALAINIVCDIVRLWTFHRTIEESKENVKETICKAINKAQADWDSEKFDRLFDDDCTLSEYFRDNFDKYL